MFLKVLEEQRIKYILENDIKYKQRKMAIYSNG